MISFNSKDGLFWLNDQPVLVQAGEFHYFRTPPDQWRHRLSLLLTAGFNAVAAYIPWIWHQVAEDTSDFDGHSHPMRNLAEFLDLASEMGLWIIPRPGPYIMAETINEGIPPWVFSRYPQVAFISQEQKPQNIVSYLHPDFLACVRNWYQAIFAVLAPRQVTRGGRIIMVQLDNEMGMMPWVRNIIDTNPDTMSRFAAHLTSSYGKQLTQRYPATDLASHLRAGILNPQEPDSARIIEDYRRFYRDYLRAYTYFLVSEATANGLEVPPVINIHGFANGGKTFPIGISQLVKVMEMDGVISATDVYPGRIGEGNIHQLLLVNEMTKALQNKQQALFSIEFQAGGNHDFGDGHSSLYDLHSRLCISCGMRAINHYLFFDGENDPVLSPVKRHDWGHPVRKDGTLRTHYARYPRLSKALKAYGEDLTRSRPTMVTSIGFLLDYFMTEVNNAATQEATSILTHQRDVILFDMLARGLTLTHRPFQAIELTRSDMDVEHMPFCWVMIEKACDPGTQQKLVDYVTQGGKLALVGRLCQEDFDHAPCTILKDALGVQAVQWGVPFESHLIRAFDYVDVPVSFLETYSGAFDEVIAWSETGETAGFIKHLGKGKVLMLGAAMTANTLEDLDIVEQIAQRMECQPLFNTDPWADVRLSKSENGSFLFIANYQDDPVETIVEYDHQTLFGGHPVHIPARRGLILPIDWQLSPNILIHYLTAELVEIIDQGTNLILKTDPPEYDAELTLTGLLCDQGQSTQISPGMTHIQVHGTTGEITLMMDQ